MIYLKTVEKKITVGSGLTVPRKAETLVEQTTAIIIIIKLKQSIKSKSYENNIQKNRVKKYDAANGSRIGIRNFFVQRR